MTALASKFSATFYPVKRSLACMEKTSSETQIADASAKRAKGDQYLQTSRVVKALFTRDILTHNIAIKRYCNKKDIFEPLVSIYQGKLLIMKHEVP